MVPTRKAQQEALVKNLQERSSSYEVTQMLALLDLLLQHAKDDLLNCDPARFVAMQSEARTYDRMIRMLNRQPIQQLSKE